jgi:hypothetical protein
MGSRSNAGREKMVTGDLGDERILRAQSLI